MSYINAIRENKILAKISEFTVHHLQEIYYQKPHENINSPAPNKYIRVRQLKHLCNSIWMC